MALIDKASLLMVPSTYEAGKLYNVLPSGNRAPDSTDQNSGYDQTRADFDFDRGSNAAATRVNASGLIEKYRENLILQSNQFDTTWSTGFSSATSGEEGYDGSNDAWLLTATGGSSSIHYKLQSISATGVMTHSLYAKAGASSKIRMTIYDGTDYQLNADLSTGTIYGTAASPIDTNITSVGNGWYRLDITANKSASGWVAIYVLDSAGNVTYTANGESIYIQDAQLESGLVASSYLDSTSVTGKAGVLVDLPRINYDANGENGALLLEPSRANLIEQSEYFGSSYWTKSGDVTLASNYGTSPEGVQNADRIVANATSGGHIVYRNISTTGTHTISIFAKASGYNHLFLGYDGGSLNFGIIFNLSNGTIAQNPAGLTGSIEAVGSDGWHRCNLTFNYATTSYYFVVAPHDNSGNYNWTGNGTDGILIYGAQLEPNASYPSSYIPTMGTSETRAADSCSVTGASDVIGQTEGTLFVEAQITKNGRLFLIGTTGNFIELVTTSGGVINAFVYNGTTQANINGSTIFDTGDTIKVAFAYKANDFALYVNGTANGTDTSGAVPSSMAQIIVNDYLSAGYNSANGYKQLALFNERLSNAELATLTTL